MKAKKKPFDEYKSEFIKEADRCIKDIARCLNRLKKEQDADSSSLKQRIHIHLHNLRGTAATLEYKKVERSCLELEAIVIKICEGRKKVTPKVIKILSEGLEKLETLLKKI